MKKVTALILALAVLLALPVAARESLDNPQAIAEYLYQQGLFKGKGADADGRPIFALEDTASRAEATVMFVRVIGKEKEALRTEYTAPFTDVPAWAEGHAGYAYTQGYMKGTGDSAFSPDRQITMQEFVVLMLRHLGYTEGTDFTWDTALSFAKTIGLTDNVPEAAETLFTRGHMVTICYNCLEIWHNNPGSDVPITDLGPKLSEIVLLDANDTNNLFPDNEGNYYVSIQKQPEGTAIVSDLLTYIPGASTDDNFQNFKNAMITLDGNISFRDNTITYGGHHGPGIYVEDGMWDIAIGCWGSNFSDPQIGNIRFGNKHSRILMLNTLRYFGDPEMANAVYCMLDEHYRFRSNNTVPISDELAVKYGLTIVSHEVYALGDIMTVTDTENIWKIAYYVDNETQASAVTIKIPIR